MKTAVIGAGVAGTSHLFDLVSSDKFEVVAVCTAHGESARSAAGTFGVPAACSHVDELLAVHSPDAVVIAVPPHETPGILSRCLTAGTWVLADKPAAPSGAALRTVIDQAGSLAHRARVAYNRRYQKHAIRARDLIAAGVLGPLTSVECQWSGPFTSRYTSGPTHRANAGPGDAVLLDTACHVLDSLTFLGLAQLTVDTARLTVLASGAEVAAEIRLTDPGRDIPVAISIRDHGDDDEWRIIVRGQRGTLELDRRELRGEYGGIPVRQAANDTRPVDDLLHLADGEPAYGASLEEAARVLDTIDQVRAAAGLGKRAWIRPRAKALGRLNGAC